MRYLLGGGILVLDATVDERGNLSRRLLDVGSLLGDSELLEELVKDLDGAGVLGRHIGGCRSVDSSDDRKGIEDREGRQR